MGVSSAKRGHLFYLSIEGCGIWGYGSASHWTRGNSHADGWADAPPIFFLRHQKENAPRPVEKKKCSAGRSAPARTSCRRRGMVGCPSRQSGTETPGSWGNLQPGEVWDTSSFSFRCRWPVVDESCSIGQTTAPTTARAARSEAERAEREAGQMRSCTPTPSALSATGRQLQKSQKTQACPKVRQNRSRHRYADPRRAEGHCTGARPAPFSLPPGAAHSLFGQVQKENGGRIAQLATQLTPPGG